jgi:kumamolisin
MAAAAVAATPVLAQSSQVSFASSVIPFDEDVQVLGTAAPQAIVHFQVGLKLRDGDALQRSNDAGKVMSWAELKARHLPTQADYDKVLNWLTSAGLDVDRTSPSRMTVWASGPVATVQRSLGVHFSRIRSEGRDYISADSAPSLPRAVAAPVLGVFGLQPQIRAYSQAVQGPAMHTDSATAAPFFPQAFLSAYNAVRLGNGGLGTTTAIVIDSFPLTTDLRKYWKDTGTRQRIANVTFINTTGLPLQPTNAETSMDTEVTSSLAPKSKVRVYGSQSLNTVDLDTTYNALIDDMGEGGVKVTQVSISLGLCEAKAGPALRRRDDNFFKAISAMGASIFVSSGDSGSQECGKKKGDTVSFYASSPNVTAVGGTRLSLNSDGTVQQETAWNLSGGGVSAYFAKPGYQSDPDLGFAKRALPDISADADPNTGAYVIINGAAKQYGGTSLSAPIMAGLTALMNANRIRKGKGGLGLLNNHLYTLKAATIRDITVGDNIGFDAGPGYDLVTGRGVPVMNKMSPALVRLP